MTLNGDIYSDPKYITEVFNVVFNMVSGQNTIIIDSGSCLARRAVIKPMQGAVPMSVGSAIESGSDILGY